MSYEKILLKQISDAGFDINKLPDNLQLHYKQSNFIGVPDWIMELFNQKVITGTALGVYINIANKCYGDKTFMWFSKQKLAKETKLNIRTIYNILNELIDAGTIAIFTQRIKNSKEKSLIFKLRERNVKDTSVYIKSVRGKGGKKKTMKPGSFSQCPQDHSLTDPYFIDYNDPDFIGIKPRTESSQGNQTKGLTDQIFSKKKFREKEININSEVYKLLKEYYQWVNGQYSINITPRQKDYENAYDLIDRVGITYTLFLQFIKETANTDSFFLKSNKNFSVWCSSVALSKYIDIYGDAFLEDIV